MTFRIKRFLNALSWAVLATFVSADSTWAQSKEELRGQIEAYRAEVQRAAAVFLDASRSESERLDAVREFPVFYDRTQIEECVKVARDAHEPGAIRAEALSKITPYIQADTTLLRDILRWLQDGSAPAPLRKAALETTRALTNSFVGMVQAREQILSAMRTLATHEDPEFREVAFSILSAHGDPYAQRLLIAGLESPGAALLSPEKSVALLGLNLHGDFYATLYKVMLDPPNAATRVEAARLLGGYREARSTLLGYLQSGRASLDLRLAAAGALNANDPENFAEHIRPVVADEGAPEELRLYGINAELLRREGGAFAAGRGTDDFDRVIRELSQRSSSEQVRRFARSYVEKVQPR